MNKPFHHLARGVIIKENKVLVAKANGYTNTFLPGGHIEFGESAKDTLVREMNEELGITCTVGSFLGLVEHKWEKKGIVHCEINQLFEMHSDELQPQSNPESKEAHLRFFWCDVNDLDKENLQAYPIRDLIQNHINGDKSLWWASSLNEEIDEANKNDV